MTGETPKPKRKRWRWIIAGVLLFVVGVWWSWPRGDARFVGKWSAWQSHPMTLNSNGMGSFSKDAIFPWRIDGEWLVIGWNTPEPLSELAGRLSYLSRRYFGTAILTRSYRYKVSLLTHDKMRLRQDDFGQSTEWTRTPE